MVNSGLFDTIVIGGGLMGSSAAWHLSDAGEKVLMADKQPEVYYQGSSYGDARITRSLGPKDDLFSWIHNRSVTETKKLAAFLDKNLSRDKSAMDEIYTSSPVTYIYYRSQKETTDGLIIGQTDPIEVAANPVEASDKFGLSTPENAIVIREFKEFSGTLNPKMLLQKLHRAIELHGNSILFNQKVTHISRRKDLFEVSLVHSVSGKRMILTAHKVIVSAGPYTGQLLRMLSPAIGKLITPKRVCLAFFTIRKEIWHNLIPEHQTKIMNFFPMIDMNPDFIFSMIEKWDESGVPVIKIGAHLKRDPITDLDHIWRHGLTTDEIEWACSGLSRYLEMLRVPIGRNDVFLSDGYSCVYSMTDSEIPIVSEISGSDNQKIPGIVVVGGMSGVGAKGSVAYGLIAKNLLLKRTENNRMYMSILQKLSMNRFPGPPDNYR